MFWDLSILDLLLIALPIQEEKYLGLLDVGI
jgi:hypothetical protein